MALQQANQANAHQDNRENRPEDGKVERERWQAREQRERRTARRAKKIDREQNTHEWLWRDMAPHKEPADLGEYLKALERQ